MYSSQKLEQLNKLFIAIQQASQHDRLHQQKFYDIHDQIEANYIAEILIQADLNKPQLNREYIRKLHSGDIKWKKDKGRSVSLKADFNFDLLEELGLIFFEYDWIYFARHLRTDDLHKTVKPIVEFAQKLQTLFYETYQTSNFLFEVDKKYTDELLPKNYRFNSEYVKYKKKKDKYIFIINFHHIQYKDLIHQFYWKKLIQYELDDVIWHKYYTLDRILDNFWMPDIGVFTDEERKKFLDFCMTNVQKSSLVQLDFVDYKKILQMDRYADLSFFSRNTVVNIDTETSKSICTSKNIPYKLNEILINHSEYIKDCQSDLELISWYHSPQSNQLLFSDYVIRSSISYLISNDLYLGYPQISSQKYVSKLIEKSKDKAVMRHYMVNISISWTGRKDVLYELYLLSDPNTFIAGCLGLMRKIKNNHYSNDFIVKSLFNDIISRIIQVMLNTALNPKTTGDKTKKDLAHFVLYLAKHSDFRQENKNIESQFFTKLFVQLSKVQLQQIAPYLIQIIKNSNKNNYYDLEITLYYLFELFSKCQKEGELGLCDLVQDLIFQSYKVCFKDALINPNNYLKTNKIYDLFAWHQLDDGYVDKFVQLCPTNKEIVISLSDGISLSYSHVLRNYLQVLSNLDRKHLKTNNNKLKNLFKKLIIDYGFDKSYSFPLLVEDYSWDSYPIWPKIIENLNEFDDQIFYEIIEGVQNNISLPAILTLYRNISQESRKQKLSEFIKSKSWDMSDDNFSAIESAFVNAVEQNQLELAKTTLQAAQKFIDQHPYKNAKMFQDKIHLWQEYQYKYDLLKIYYSENSIEEKEQKINQVLLPDVIKETNYSNEKFASIDRFKRYTIGLLFLKTEPDKANQIFVKLNDEYKSSLYAHFVFASKLQSLFNSKAEKSKYLSIIDLYKQSFNDFYNDLPLHYKSDYLYGLYLAGQYEEVSSLCSKLPYFELFDKSITVTYVKSMKDNQNELKAKEHLDEYVRYHSVDLNDDELQILKEDVDLAIRERVEPIQREILHHRSLISVKTNDELRTIYGEICQSSINDLAYIIGPKKNPEKFLYDAVLNACQELLTRNKNLQILGAETNEDITNDWLTSLLSHKFSWFPITVHDQKRTGKSASGKSPGETDGMIMYSDVDVSMIEAFKLKSLDKAVINNHLNKIAGYAQSAITPIFIVVYAYATDFISLTNNYCNHIKNIQYKGFEKIDNDQYEIKTLEDKGDDIVMVCEKRYRNERKVSIYHIMINLTV